MLLKTKKRSLNISVITINDNRLNLAIKGPYGFGSKLTSKMYNTYFI